MRSRFGEESRRIVGGYSIEAAADGIVDGCLGALRSIGASGSGERIAA
jgi:hypothetical protein